MVRERKDRRLTSKQERFARLVAAGETQAAAYRLAYSPTPRMTNKSIHEEASRVASNLMVASRLAELQAVTARRAEAAHAVSTDSLLVEAESAFQLAAAKLDVAAMVAAIRLKAQLTGLLVRERDNGRAPLQDVPDEQVEAELARLREEREASSRQIH